MGLPNGDADYIHEPTVSSGLAGYLASSITYQTTCGGSERPWFLEAQPGQKINLTLYDFSVEQRFISTRFLNPEAVEVCIFILTEEVICYHLSVWVCLYLNIISKTRNVTCGLAWNEFSRITVYGIWTKHSLTAFTKYKQSPCLEKSYIFCAGRMFTGQKYPLSIR